MKKLFTKRSGFTLVEILVAFAVFAVMALMVLSLMQITVREKAYNNQLAYEAQLQQEALVLNEKETEYDNGETKDGTMMLDFNASSGNINVPIDYQLHGSGATDTKYSDHILLDDTGSNKEAGINYFIGAAGASGGTPETPKKDEDEEGGSVTNRLDCRIFGSINFQYIDIADVSDVSTMADTAAGNKRFTFKSGAQNKPNVIAYDKLPYRSYRLRFPSTIVDCGYVINGEMKSYKTFDDITLGTPFNKNSYEILKTTDDTVRVFVPLIDILTYEGLPGSERDGGGDDNAIVSKYFFNQLEYSNFYVVLKDNGKLDGFDEKSFGAKSETADAGTARYYSLIGTATDPEHPSKVIETEYPNIYGAYALDSTTVLEMVTS